MGDGICGEFREVVYVDCEVRVVVLLEEVSKGRNYNWFLDWGEVVGVFYVKWVVDELEDCGERDRLKDEIGCIRIEMKGVWV